MIYLNLLIISFLIVFIIDYSGFIDEMEGLLNSWLKSKIRYHIPKPFSCSLCMVWWCGLIYLLIVGALSFKYIGFVALMCCLTQEMLQLIYLLKDFIGGMVDMVRFYSGLDKII